MINLEWVSEYIDIRDEDFKELAVKITKAGINVEKVISKHIDNIVVGEVLKCEKHPDSDHLHICLVNVGDYTTQIICGAPNIRKELKVIVAIPGAILPGDFEIKSSKIRGQESNGMICALYELGLEEKTEETHKKGIEELPLNAPIGIDALKYLKLDDTLYELDIHKHRNNDCYYHIGFAYEIAAILNKKVILPNLKYKQIKEDIKDKFNLTVETDKCPYYLAKMVTDIEIKESPDFIKKRLISVGMRPINNIVDISNYIMLEYGQPMHFFDKDKLGNTIVVRNAKKNEKITTLDSKERVLSDSDIVITDGTKPVAIAGVMGGLNTDIDINTKNILIESAIFEPISIRYTSQRLNLRSEASIRYGKGLNYEYTTDAINRACYLLEKYANAKILSGVVSHDKIDKTEKVVEFTADDINKILGITISTNDMITELKRLDFSYKLNDNKFIVTIPKRRLDIEANTNDIAEEIGRLYGYHNLISTLPKGVIKKGQYVGDVKYRKLISKRLRSLGLNEVKTYTLVSPNMSNIFKYENKENIILPSPMSIDKSIIRTTLIPSLLNVYEYNLARHIDDVLIYEISKTYDKNLVEDTKISILMKGNYINNSFKDKYKTDFYLIKGILENLLDYLGLKNRYSYIKDNISNMHPGVSTKILLDKKDLGVIGKVHPNITKDDIYVCEISLNKLITDVKKIKYKPSSKFPAINKDMAFYVDKEISCNDIIKTILSSSNKLVKDVTVFDVYTGNNIDNDKKSIAFSLKFEDDKKTLTDEEVMLIFNNIIKEVTAKYNAVLRNN